MHKLLSFFRSELREFGGVQFFSSPVHALSRLSRPETVNDGNGILGHLLGSKDVSRQVAANAATQTGIGADVLKKMLPMLASLAMAAMAQRAMRGPNGQVQLGEAGGGGGLMDMLGPMLGGGGGASSGGLGDIIGSLGQLFRR